MRLNRLLLVVIPVLLLLTIWIYPFEQESYDVVVILKNRFLTEYWQEVKNGIEKSAENHPVNIEFLSASSESDIEGQIQLVADAIEMKPDAIMLASNDYHQLVDSAMKITSNGIKLVIIDSGINYSGFDSFVATDNYVGGYKAGEQLASLLDEGSTVVLMNYSTGSQTAIEREEGVVQALKDSGKSFMIETYYCYDQVDEASRITEYLLKDNPDIKGMISLNETSSIGVARGIDALELSDTVSLVGYDSSHEELDYLEQGVIDALIVQKPFNMGYLGMETTYQLIEGESVDKLIDTGSKLITIDNMFDKENIDLLFPFTE